MRTEQINPPAFAGGYDLAAGCPGSNDTPWIGSGVFAVPHLPGRVERFRTLSGMGKLSDDSFFPLILQESPYPFSRRYRRR